MGKDFLRPPYLTAPLFDCPLQTPGLDPPLVGGHVVSRALILAMLFARRAKSKYSTK